MWMVMKTYGTGDAIIGLTIAVFIGSIIGMFGMLLLSIEDQDRYRKAMTTCPLGCRTDDDVICTKFRDLLRRR